MSSKSFLIDTTKSMIIIDPSDFPMNLEKTFREDSPVSGFPIQAFEARNVLPTAVGYKSYFRHADEIDVPSLGDHVQKVYTYQTANMYTLLVALAEDGIYITEATEGDTVGWDHVVDTSAGEVADVRRLWTSCVIANTVYFYQQGAANYYALVTPDDYDTAQAGPTPIAGATRTPIWEIAGKAGLIRYTPSFLNMSGQIGLFKAKNRLGFWDSDNAVAWSSATYTEDFKPSAQTFAGVTKFVDVQGRIVMVLGSGDSFIIYATKSIVIARSLDGSPERWSGSAIMSDVGVAFDTQISTAQPDQIHYCITQAGLLQITNGQPEYIATEVLDYLAKLSPLVSLTVIEGRYIFLSILETFPGSNYAVDSVIVEDFDGRFYTFQRPVSTDPQQFNQYLNDTMQGRSQSSQDAFNQYTEDPLVDPPDNEQPLIPCYDVTHFYSTWINSTYTRDQEDYVYFDSDIFSGIRYELFPGIYNLIGSPPSYDVDTNAGIDLANEELAAKITEGLELFNAHKQYETDWAADLDAADIDVDVGPTFGSPIVGIMEPATLIYVDKVIADYEFDNHILTSNIRVKANDCDIHLYVDRYSTFKIETIFNGIEILAPGKVYLFRDPVSYLGADPLAAYMSPLPAAADAIAWSAKLVPALVDELKALYDAQFPDDDDGISSYISYEYLGSYPTYGAEDYNYLTRPAEDKARALYLGWILSWNPDDVTPESIDDVTALAIKVVANNLLVGSGYNRTNLIRPTLNFSPFEDDQKGARSTLARLYYWADSERLLTPWCIKNAISSTVPLYSLVRTSLPGSMTQIDLYTGSIVGVVPPGGSLYPKLGNSYWWADDDPTFEGLVDDSVGFWSLEAPPFSGGVYTNAEANELLDDEWKPIALAGSTSVPEQAFFGEVFSLKSISYNSTPQWTVVTQNDHLNALGFTGSTKPIARLQGSIQFRGTWEDEDVEQEITLLRLEQSGWGYIPTAGANFRKTHLRHGSTSCGIPGGSFPVAPDELDKELNFGVPASLGNKGSTSEGFKWPGIVPIDTGYNPFLFQRGSLSPYYPLYTGAAVFDLLLQKWGMYNSPHYALVNLLPVNRVDSTIMPIADKGMFAGALNEYLNVVLFNEENPDSYIVYGKAGFYRRGLSFATEIRAHFNPPATGTLVVECSVDGVRINPNLSYSVDLVAQRNAILPFTRRAKWFTIRIVGNFNLHYLELLAEEKSRR